MLYSRGYFLTYYKLKIYIQKDTYMREAIHNNHLGEVILLLELFRVKHIPSYRPLQNNNLFAGRRQPIPTAYQHMSSRLD